LIREFLTGLGERDKFPAFLKKKNNFSKCVKQGWHGVGGQGTERWDRGASDHVTVGTVGENSGNSKNLRKQKTG